MTSITPEVDELATTLEGVAGYLRSAAAAPPNAALEAVLKTLNDINSRLGNIERRVGLIERHVDLIEGKMSHVEKDVQEIRPQINKLSKACDAELLEIAKKYNTERDGPIALNRKINSELKALNPIRSTRNEVLTDFPECARDVNNMQEAELMRLVDNLGWNFDSTGTLSDRQSRFLKMIGWRY